MTSSWFYFYLLHAVSSIQGATKQGTLCFKILGAFREAKTEDHMCKRRTFLCDLKAATESSERLSFYSAYEFQTDAIKDARFS